MVLAELSSLQHLLHNSLSNQEALRKDAEDRLGAAATQPDFGVVLLQVATDNQCDATIRQAAAIYFKNFVNKRYDPYDESKISPLIPEDKSRIRSLMVSAIVSCASTIRPQLLAAVEKIIRADFPKQWPTLLDELYPIISGGETEKILSGLAIFHELVSWNGGTSAGEIKEMIHGRFFPILLNLIQSNVQFASQAQHEAVAVVKAILKCYYAAIQYRFSGLLMLGDAFSAWCTVITQVITCKPPASIVELSVDEADVHPFWKMKKWAIRVHNKIFQRYGCPKLDSFSNTENMSFAKFYMGDVAVPVLNVYLQQIESNIAGVNPFTERIFCLICDFLESCIRHKRTWSILEPHVVDILTHFCFPRVCFSEEDQELWEDDPEEYIKSKLDPFEELYSFTSSSVSFTLDLIKCRKKKMFVPILQFINSLLSQKSTDMESMRKKDGALFLLGSMSRILLTSDFKNQIESVVVSFVIPELANTQGFLRMRACWTIEQFDDIEYTPNTAMSALQGILHCLGDSQLPVCVAACGALGSLLDNEAVQQALPPMLSEVIEALMGLINVIQLDSIAFVLEKIVQMFAEHLTPFAVQLCIQLRNTVARHLEGYTNVLDVDIEDESFGQGTDKMMAVVGMFKAIETLVDLMGQTPELVASLEEVVLPLLALVFERQIVDVYEEAFELIDTITFARKSISPAMWSLFPYLYKTFKDVGADYIQDMHTSLDNFISYGSNLLLSDEKYVQMMNDVVKTTMTDELFTEHDHFYGCKLMESLLLNCRGRVDAYVSGFIELVLPPITALKDYPLSSSMLISHLEVVLNAMYYNCPLALTTLEHLNATANFFSMWFNNASKFTRVHDKRLIIVSIISLMSLPYDELPSFLQQNYQFILPVFLFAVQTLPKALEDRKKLQEEGSVSDSDLESYNDEADYDEVNDDTELEDAISNITSNSTQFVERNEPFDDEEGNDHSGNFYDDDEEELEEEPFFESPLDNLDIASLIQQSLHNVAKTQPLAFARLTQTLNAEQAAFLKSIVQ